MATARNPRPRGLLGRLLPQSLLGRQLLALSVVLIAGNAAVLFQAHSFVREDLIGAEQRRILAVARALASPLAGTDHEALAAAAPGRGAFLRWADAPEAVQATQLRLAGLAGGAGLDVPVTTLRMKDELRQEIAAAPDRPHRKALEAVLSSADAPAWREEVDYDPTMKAAFFGATPSVSAPQVDGGAAWISATVPLVDAQGAVEGILELRQPMDALHARIELRQQRVAALVGAMVLFVLAAVALTVRQLSAGLRRVEAAAQRIGRGDYRTPVRIQSLSEVQRLAGSLEQARQSVAIRTLQLASMRDELDQQLRDARQAIDGQDRDRRHRFAALKGKLDITLEVGDQPVAAALTDLGFDRVVLVIAGDQAPDLAAGMGARIHMVPPDGSAPCVLEVRARSRSEQGDEVQLSFVPTRPMVLESLPEDVRRIISQRRTQRFSPTDDHPVAAAVRRGPRLAPVEVEVIDISSGGLKVRLPVAFDDFSTWGSFLQVALRFADDDGEVRLALGARVRACHPMDDDTGVGLEFDAETTPHLDRHQARIASWVMARERERREQERDDSHRSAQAS